VIFFPINNFFNDSEKFPSIVKKSLIPAINFNTHHTKINEDGCVLENYLLMFLHAAHLIQIIVAIHKATILRAAKGLLTATTLPSPPKKSSFAVHVMFSEYLT
jgi:hypothetical protein